MRSFADCSSVKTGNIFKIQPFQVSRNGPKGKQEKNFCQENLLKLSKNSASLVFELIQLPPTPPPGSEKKLHQTDEADETGLPFPQLLSLRANVLGEPGHQNISFCTNTCG